MTDRRLAIFDFDGTLADSAAWFFGVVGEAARQHGFREISDEEREMLRDRSTREILAYLGVPLWKLPALARDMRARVARDVDRIHPFPWVPDVIARLHANGVALAIVSSNSEANIRRILGPDLAARIGFCAAGASLFGKASKIRQAVRWAAVPAAAAVAIGDEVRDIEAARQAGVAALAVTWGFASAAALRAAAPEAVVDDPEDLVRRLLQPA
jgi:phosphoglycolate phosphatase